MGKRIPVQLKGNQEIQYINGYQTTVEMKVLGKEEFLLVSIYGYTTKDSLRLEVAYGNGTKSKINVLPEQIEVIGYSDSSTEFVKVWEANAYLRMIERNQNMHPVPFV